MLGVTNDQNYNDIADALREVGADLSEETFTPSEMAPAIRGLRSRWGNIEGDIANQTDLQNALNSKADSADLGTMSEEDDAPSDNKQYGRKNGDWVPITDELANWGQIAGDLSDQTDLQEALDAKADAADLGTMSEEDDAPSDNKQYGRKNGDWVPITDELTNKPDLNDKATVITETKSGSIVSISDGAEAPVSGLSVSIEPMQDLHGYDAPWPAGGGVNLLPPQTLSQTSSGVTISSDNGVYTLTGTPTEYAQFVSNDTFFLDAGTYALLSNKSSVGNSVGVQIRSTDGTTTYASSISSVSTFTLSERTEVRFRIVTNSGESGTITLKPQLESGSTAGTFSPYSNICPISGHTSATVTRTGKNLYIGSPSFDGFTYINNWTVSSELYNGHEVIYKNSAWGGVYKDIQLNAGKTYTFSAMVKATSAINVTVFNTGVGGLKTIALSPNTWTKISANYTALQDESSRFRIETGVSGETLYVSEYQLELGSTATAYESYQGTSVTIDLDGTRYGAQLDVLTGEMTVTKAGHIFDGTETITNGYNRLNWVTDPNLKPIIKDNQKNAISSFYPAKTANEIWSNRETSGYLAVGCTQGGGSGFILIIDNVNCPTKDTTAYKAWLASQYSAGTPLIVVWNLATPFTVQLSPSQLSTFLGTNHIWADTGDVAVTYRADSKMYIDQKVDEAVRKTKQVIAAVTDTMVAPSNLTAGDFIIVGDDLIKATSNVASGATLTIGSNCVKTTVAEALIALASA